jgi:hypothetical protein
MGVMAEGGVVMLSNWNGSNRMTHGEGFIISRSVSGIRLLPSTG